MINEKVKHPLISAVGFGVIGILIAKSTGKKVSSLAIRFAVVGAVLGVAYDYFKKPKK